MHRYKCQYIIIYSLVELECISVCSSGIVYSHLIINKWPCQCVFHIVYVCKLTHSILKHQIIYGYYCWQMWGFTARNETSQIPSKYELMRLKMTLRFTKQQQQFPYQMNEQANRLELVLMLSKYARIPSHKLLNARQTVDYGEKSQICMEASVSLGRRAYSQTVCCFAEEAGAD